MYKKLLKTGMLALLMFLFVSCSFSTDTYTDYLDKKTETEIINKKAELTNIDPNYIDVLYFFGGYNNAYVVFMDPAPITSGLTETVSGITFEYTTERKMEVYYEGVFYSLYDALNNKILTSENILKIKENFDKKENLGMTEKLKGESLLKEDFNKIVEVYPYLMIDKYLGSYNGSNVVWYEEFQNNLGIVNYINVSGMIYDEKDYTGIKVIKDKESYDLLTAYNSNLLSVDDLKTIFKNFYGYNLDEFIYENNRLSLQTRYNILVEYYNKYISEREKDFKLVWLYTLELILVKEDVFVLYTVPELNSNIVIDNLVFPNEIEIIVCKNNKVYDLIDAYADGIVTKDDVITIYNSFK